MLAWHLAAVTFLFRWIFRDPKVDMRFLFAGILLPDLIDLTAVTFLGGTSGELWAHSLIVPTVIAVVVMAATRRGRRRRGWMALVVAWLFHLLIDRMWLEATVFFWPLFGLGLDTGGMPFWEGAWQRAIGDPWRWVLEVVGLAYLAWLAVASGLNEREARTTLVRTGRIGNRSLQG